MPVQVFLALLGEGCGFGFCVSSCKLLEFRDGAAFVGAVVAQPPSFLYRLRKNGDRSVLTSMPISCSPSFAAEGDYDLYFFFLSEVKNPYYGSVLKYEMNKWRYSRF